MNLDTAIRYREEALCGKTVPPAVLQIAIATIQTQAKPRTRTEPADEGWGLTELQESVLEHLAGGATLSAIAEMLRVTQATVQQHVRAAAARMHVSGMVMTVVTWDRARRPYRDAA